MRTGFGLLVEARDLHRSSSVIERILTHIGEPVEAPEVLLARGPSQTELAFGQADQTAGQEAWPEMDQTAGDGGDTWE